MSNTVPPMCWDAILKILAIFKINEGLYLRFTLVEEIYVAVKRVWIGWKRLSDFQDCFLISALKRKLQ